MKRIIPFGDRVLVKRQKTGEHRVKGTIVLPDEVEQRDTDIATVKFIPDLTFTDQTLLKDAEGIIEGLSGRAKDEPEALKQLLNLNQYLKLRTLKVGDMVMMSKYVGTDFKD